MWVERSRIIEQRSSSIASRFASATEAHFSLGIAAQRLSTRVYGATAPKDTNETPEGRAATVASSWYVNELVSAA
jgi:flagellar motor protein MotB